MGCCAPNEVGSGAAAADPCKRVNYTLGMLLGVDDFVQESAYHGARRRELARELLGYGTVHGLQVVVEPDGDRGPRVRVMPGMAWLPSGTPVCVASPQCANLNDWLALHHAELGSAAATTPLALYVVLSHAQCLTDNVPIPGEPCRDDADLMQPSRVADSFRLELRLAPPPQREEDAIRDFVAWLLDVPLAASSPPLDEQEFIDQLRAAAHAWLAPTSPPPAPADYMIGSAPAGTSEQLLAAALRLWTTELRPLWMARAGCGCDAQPVAPADDAVLLAQLRVALVEGSPAWQVKDGAGAVQQDESRRPYVLSLRMLQELITLHPVPDAGDSVAAETAFAQAQSAGVSLHYARADHTHGTPPKPVLGGDASGVFDANTVDKIKGVPVLAANAATDNGKVLTLDGGTWKAKSLPAPPPPSPLAMTGDVSGFTNASTVDKIKGVQVLAANATADEGKVLTLEGGVWKPKPATGAATAGQFVARGEPGLKYEIAAAAYVLFGTARVTTIESRYGDIRIPDRRDPRFDGRVVQIFDQSASIPFTLTVPQAARYHYIVKLTPILAQFAFRLFLGILKPGTDAVQFEVLVLGDTVFEEQDGDFPFQLEVSRYEARQ